MVFPVFFFLGSWLHCTKYLLGISHNFQDFLLILAENEVVIALQVSEVPYMLGGRLISIEKHHYSFVGALFAHSNSNSLFGFIVAKYSVVTVFEDNLLKHLRKLLLFALNLVHCYFAVRVLFPELSQHFSISIAIRYPI